jgi:uncharacterized membrane protein
VKKYLDYKPEKMFIALALIFGLIMTFFNPPFNVNDENWHFYKSYDVSQGHLIPESILSSAQETIGTPYWPEGPIYFNADKIIYCLNQPFNFKQTSKLDISNIAIYPPTPYLASAFILFLGRLFNSSPLFLMYMGRLINLLIYIIIVYFAIKIIPIQKYVLLLVALMPRTILAASSLSADSFNIAISLLTISFILNLVLIKPKIIKKDLFISISLILVLSLSKQIYALISLLFLIIPKEKFKNPIRKTISFLTIIIPSLVTLITWNSLFKNLYGTRIALSSQQDNLILFLQDPSNFLFLLMKTLTSLKMLDFYMGTLILAGGSQTINFLFYSYITILVIVAVIATSKYKLSFKTKFVPLSIFLTIFLIVFFFEFITFTYPNSKFIEGVQGRYFIPVLPLFFLISITIN